MASKPKEYRALVGMDFNTGEVDEETKEPVEVRVEAGDKIVGMPDDELKHQVRIGNAEVWKERKTDNVQRLEDVPVVVHGVTSRHANQGEDIVLKEVEAENG